ncbi:hypothetical protein [Geminocystis sp. GBBB08]|uniref:hypothetical protein n=1 Tax=Geminocystis sp. GBBB08 TaxID=2604140 RepID=UPI0027E36D6D|nr:hypothetical protein [Geminocystis sp. GBBB08]MBL1208627.1 hypothetical protein [Geminocystis sp. GBBB08]
MNIEDIQNTIEGMLAVQRGLQESQLKLHEEQLKLNQALEQLLNLHITHEIKHIDYEERLLQLTRRIENLEKS